MVEVWGGEWLVNELFFVSFVEVKDNGMMECDVYEVIEYYKILWG